MEFRNVRDGPRQAEQPAESGRPDAEGRADEVAQSPGGDGQPESSAEEEAGSDGARLVRSQAADRSESAPESAARQPEALARPPMGSDRQRLAERLASAENRGGIHDELQDRLNQLESGHPSSPWHEDGTPRPPAPKLSDLEQTSPGLSDADYAAHVLDVKRELGAAGKEKLTTKELFTIDGNGKAWVMDRRHAHDEIIREIYESAADVPCDHKAIIAGGLGGAGKTTVLEQYADVARADFLTINPDDIKEELVRRELVPRLPGLSPMESASLAHEESSHVARVLAIRAMADGKNIIWDVTLSSPESASGRVAELRSADYQHIDGIFVDIPIETSVERAAARHRRGHEQYLSGEGLGGRFVSEDIIRSQYDPTHGTVNRKAFESIKNDLNQWVIYDNSVEGRPPELMAEKDAWSQ
jgi:predicted ABC-type ATPase